MILICEFIEIPMGANKFALNHRELMVKQANEVAPSLGIKPGTKDYLMRQAEWLKSIFTSYEVEYTESFGSDVY